MTWVLLALPEGFIELLLTEILGEVLLLEPHRHGEERMIDELCGASSMLGVSLQTVMEKVDAIGT